MLWNHMYCIINGEFNTMRVIGVPLNILLLLLVKGFQGKFLSTMNECYYFLSIL
jgi:hypothetical protein